MLTTIRTYLEGETRDGIIYGFEAEVAVTIKDGKVVSVSEARRVGEVQSPHAADVDNAPSLGEWYEAENSDFDLADLTRDWQAA